MGLGARLFVWNPDTLSEERMVQPVVHSDTLTVNTAPTVYTTRIYTDSSYTYIAKALPGSLETQSVWQIARIDSSGNKLFAGGASTFVNRADQYAGLSYS